MQSGKIQSSQVQSYSLFKNDYRYGADNARLNKTSFPPGYLSAENTCSADGSFSIKFNTKTFVTGIATQGYGDEKMNEWVKSYSLYWQPTASRDSYLTPVPVKVNRDI